MSENNLKMSSSPHIRSKATTSNIMMLVAIALLPASAFGVWNFGLPAFGMLVTTTVVAVLTEYIYEKLMHKKDYDQRLECSCNRSVTWTEYAAYSTMVDGCDR